MLAYPLFNEVIHTLGVGFDIFGREIVPSRIEAQGYGIVGFTRGDGGNDFGFGHAGDTAEAGNRGRLNAEEIDENGIVAAEVLIGQIKKGRIAFAQVFDDGAQAFCAADQENIVVAVAAFQDLFVQGFVFLVRIHAGQRHILIERVNRHFKCSKVRIEDDDFFAGGKGFVEMVFVLIAYQRAQLVRRRVPVEAVFEHQLRHVLEVAFEQGGALAVVQLGKAFFEVDLADFAARFDRVIGENTDRVGNLVQHAKRQQADEVEKKEGGFHEGSLYVGKGLL